MATNLVHRMAEVDDATGIATIHVLAWQAAYRGLVPSAYLDSLSIADREQLWRRRLQPGETGTWLATMNGRLAGWISTGSSRDSDATASTGELFALYVHPEHWGQGVGEYLWQQAEARMKSAGFETVTLWVLRGNHRAIRFYLANHFDHDFAEKTEVLDGTELVEVRLRKRLA